MPVLLAPFSKRNSVSIPAPLCDLDQDRARSFLHPARVLRGGITRFGSYVFRGSLAGWLYWTIG